MLLAIAIAVGSLVMAPFEDWAEQLGISPLAIDAIPNIGDNLQNATSMADFWFQQLIFPVQRGIVSFSTAYPYI